MNKNIRVRRKMNILRGTILLVAGVLFFVHAFTKKPIVLLLAGVLTVISGCIGVLMNLYERGKRDSQNLD